MPKKNVPSPIMRIAEHNYDADDPDEELSFRRGDVILVLGKSDDKGWLRGKIQGSSKQGLFPMNYTAVYEPDDEEEQFDDDDETKSAEEDEEEVEEQPPTRKLKPGRLQIPQLSHVATINKAPRPAKPDGKLLVELPTLNHVEKRPLQKESSNSGLLALPALRKVDQPLLGKSSASVERVSAPLSQVQLRPTPPSLDKQNKDVESKSSFESAFYAPPPAGETTISLSDPNPNVLPVSLLERQQQATAATPTLPIWSKAQLRPVELPGLAQAPRRPSNAPPLIAQPTFSSQQGAITQTKPMFSIPKAPPGMPSRSPSIVESSLNARPGIPKPLEQKRPEWLAKADSKRSEFGTTASPPAPPVGFDSPNDHPTQSIEKNSSNAIREISKRIPARSMTVTDPPPPEFYSPDTDAFSCSVQVTRDGAVSEKVEKYSITRADRSQVEISIHQVSGQPDALMKAIIKPFAGFPPDALERFARDYGSKVVSFCQRHFGKRVGNGECWTLAEHALKDAKCSPPTAYNFGQRVELNQVRPGDIIHFTSCLFVYSNGQQTAGNPNHVAIVSGEVVGSLIPVFEQNPKPCAPGSYDLSCLRSGSVVFYRPIPLN